MPGHPGPVGERGPLGPVGPTVSKTLITFYPHNPSKIDVQKIFFLYNWGKKEWIKLVNVK